ncbi:hypothetical protein N9B82_02065 [Saprospiraceae bacterium]|nr:hypothetical protein [Saprospiraceae bacterium]
MKSLLILTIIITSLTSSFAQNHEAGSVEWLQALYVHGVEMTDDTIYIREEVLSLLADEDYRNEFYQNQGNWVKTMEYIKGNDLKKACWNLINLSMINEYSQEKVVKTYLTYNKMFDMEKILISSFYTYCYTDPSIGLIEDGKPIIKAPHILEEKLEAVKEIILYAKRYEQQLAQSAG